MAVSTVTEQLARRIDEAFEAIPISNRLAPLQGEVFSDPDDAFQRIQDWAFTQGYAFVTASKVATRVRFDCIHHKTETRNTRKTAEEDRQRVETHVRGTGCLYGVYISVQKKYGGQWVFGYSKHTDHNHPPSPDPFQLLPHRHRRPGFKQALQIASTHRGTIGFAASSDILSKMGLELDRKAFYNLQRKESEGQISSQEEALLILSYLEGENFHVEINEEYVLGPGGERVKRVVKDIIWFSNEQIRMAQRFVSEFLLEGDATFSTNERNMLLQNLIGVDNTGTTFGVLQAFITSESKSFWKFLNKVLALYFFFKCPAFRVLCADFGGGVTAWVAEQAAEEAAAARRAEEEAIAQQSIASALSENEAEQQSPLQLADPLPSAPAVDSQTIVVDWVASTEDTLMAPDGGQVILQRCQWHAAEAIKRRLIKKGYKKEKRDELVTLMWSWIKAPDLEALTTARDKFILALRTDEKEYLVGYYQPKEPSFCSAYTCRYPNLGVESTQRNESFHHNASRGLSKSLPLYQAVAVISQRVVKIAREYDSRINTERVSLPRLIDRSFFQLVIRKLTHYCLRKAMLELVLAKQLLDKLEKEGKVFDFDVELGCQVFCELPLRFGIPCKCWMAHFFRCDKPIPLSLFHPRWLFDGPPFLSEPWKMSFDNVKYDQSTILEDRYQGDRFANRGDQLILDTALLMAEKHKNLPPGEAAKFAIAFKEINDTLANRQYEKLKGKEVLPSRLPDKIVQPKLVFGPGRKRALTGREIADQQEADAARARRKAERLAKEQDDIEDAMAMAAKIQSQHQDDVTASYFSQQDEPANSDEDAKSDSDEWADIDDFEYLKKISQLHPSSNGESSTAPQPCYQWESINSYVHSSQQKSQIQPEFVGIIDSNSDEDIPEEEPLEEQYLLNNAVKSNTKSLPDLLSALGGDHSDEEVPQTTSACESSSSDNSGEEFPEVAELCSQALLQKATSIAAGRPKRNRIPSAKQASQDCRAVEARRAKEERLKNKSRKKETTQLDDFELLFRSS
jgi:hypothetical protein